MFEIEKLISIIEKRYQKKSDSIDVILKEINMLDKKIKYIERSIRSLYSNNCEQDEILKMQSILFKTKSLSNRLQIYITTKDQNVKPSISQQRLTAQN